MYNDELPYQYLYKVSKAKAKREKNEYVSDNTRCVYCTYTLRELEVPMYYFIYYLLSSQILRILLLGYSTVRGPENGERSTSRTVEGRGETPRFKTSVLSPIWIYARCAPT